MVSGSNLQVVKRMRLLIQPQKKIIGKASKANSEDVQKALKSAANGLKIWRDTSPWERAKIIRKISDLMRKNLICYLNG